MNPSESIGDYDAPPYALKLNTLSRIETFRLKVPLGNDRFYSSQCSFPQRKSLLIKITTDDGLVGWGESGQYGPYEPVEACINDILAPLLLGEKAIAPTAIWEKMYNLVRDFGQKGPYIEAISGLDIALWDLLGKQTGLPVYALLGGAVRKDVETYATGCYYRGDDVLDIAKTIPALKEEARQYVELGFRILKLKIGLLSIDQDIERIRAIRDEVGTGIDLLIDANHAYNVHNAIRVGKELEALGVLFFEEPVIPEDKEGYRRVRDALTIPIAGGECEYTRYGFKDLFAGHCVDIAQPDLSCCGGISEGTKIVALASSFNKLVIPHVWGSGVAVAAALQLLATIPVTPHTANPVPLQNEPVFEFDRNINPLRDELLNERFCLAEGRLQIPDGPGLGISVNEAILEKYRV